VTGGRSGLWDTEGRSAAAPTEGLDRRSAWATLLIAVGVLVVTAALVVPWDWVPGGTLRPARATDIFSAEHLRAAENHASAVRWLSRSSTAVSLLLAAVLGFTRLGARLSEQVARFVPRWLTVPVVVLLLLLAGRLVTLPFALAVRGRNLEAGLTRQELPAWFVDRGSNLLVSWVVTTLLVALVLTLARRHPRRWFALAAPAAGGLVVLGSYLYPLVVEPLFNDFEPLRDEVVVSKVLELAEAEGVEVDEVLVADASRRTTTLNAYVSGLGGTRRVVVYDTLLEAAPTDELLSVVAHELAHARHPDVLLGTGLGALGAFAGVTLLALVLDGRWLRRRTGVRGAADPAATALLVALIAWGGFLATPAQNTVSRAIEARADRTALEATGDAAGFVRLQQRLAERSLADPTPPRWSQLWFGSHPTVLERIGLARAVLDGQPADDGSAR
jgi:STE24 endopeptidase